MAISATPLFTKGSPQQIDPPYLIWHICLCWHNLPIYPGLGPSQGVIITIIMVIKTFIHVALFFSPFCQTTVSSALRKLRLTTTVDVNIKKVFSNYILPINIYLSFTCRYICTPPNNELMSLPISTVLSNCTCYFTPLVRRAGLSMGANLQRSMASETMALGVNAASGSESNSRLHRKL